MPSDQTAHGLETVTAHKLMVLLGQWEALEENLSCHYCSGDGGKAKESGHEAISKQVSLVLSTPRLALNSLFYVYGKSCTSSLAWPLGCFSGTT